MTSGNSTSLIPVVSRAIGADTVQTVSARALHAFLEVKRDFPTWFKDQVGRYEFADGTDFCEVSPGSGENASGGRPTKEYALTLDAAKELSMVERNAKGKEARQYFIECERRAKAGHAVDPLSTLPPEQRALVQLMIDQEQTKQRVAVTEDKVRRIEAKQAAFEEGSKYFTVIGFFVYRGLPAMSFADTAQFGKRATKLSKERGMLVDKVRDPRFGVVGSYHEDVLQSVLDEFMGGAA